MTMNKPITIGKYRIKGIVYYCFYLEGVQYAVAEKAVNRIGSGEEVCRVSAGSEQQAKNELAKCLDDKFDADGFWEI